MLYESLWQNLIYITKALGYITVDQLDAIFEDHVDYEKLRYYINRLISIRELELIDAKEGILKAHLTTILTPVSMRSRLNAISVMTAKKSKELVDMFVTRYPSQIGFITSDNIYYDVTDLTTCIDTTLAQLARQKWLAGLPEGAEDLTHHVALVSNKNFAEELKNFGFSSFCTLNGLGEPQFYVFQ